MSDSETLQRIEHRVSQLDEKVDRLLIGSPGDEGLLTRVARVEERQSFAWWSAVCSWVAWIVTAGAALTAWLLPGLFRSPQ